MHSVVGRFRSPLFILCIFYYYSFSSIASHSCAALTVVMASSSDTTLHLPLETLSASANAYAAANGVQVESKTTDGSASSVYQSAPMSLLPQAYPKAAFQQAIALAPSFNVLVDRISRDGAFLQQTLGGSVSTQDRYTAKLLQLYNKIYVGTDQNEAAVSADRLGILRSDYMLNKQKGGGSNEYEIKQVELNTIASSFAGLACQVANLHSYLIQRYAGDNDLHNFLLQNQQAVTGTTTISSSGTDCGVPVNPTLERLPSAMNVAVQRYKERFSAKQACVLFVVQEGETNTVDQRMLEFRLFAQHQIPVVRLSLAKIHTLVKLDESTGVLTLNDDDVCTEVAVVYYRAGYAPTDYPDGDTGIEWQAREKLECSRATKCPSLGYHLAGTKKVQQELARPGVLERFFPGEADKVQGMRGAFAGLYSLGDDAVDEDYAAVRDVLAGGHGRYVLKPQREGGGYNFYGEQLAAKLRENVVVQDADGTIKLDDKLGEYILMERLFPPQQKAVLLRSGRVEGSGESISELGCFGTVLVSAEGEVVHNEYAGFLLRTKFSNVDEGGVASGFATLSSPYLC
jgi:glutathione synthase